MFVGTQSQEDMNTNMTVTHYLSSSTNDVWFTLSGKIKYIIYSTSVITTIRN